MKRIIKKLFIVVLILALLVVDGFCSLALEGTEKSAESEEKITSKAVVAETTGFELYIDELGHIEAANKSTGYVWSSLHEDIENDRQTVGINSQYFQSEIVVNYVYRDDFGQTSSYEENSVSGIEAVQNNAVSVYKTEYGAKVVYDFYSICASIAIQYSINGNCLSVEIKGEEILEGDAFKKKVKDYATQEQLDIMQESYITSVWVLPAFGAGNRNDSGFVFVPDGSGAYMDFKPVSYAAKNVTIPIFGEEYALDEYGVVSEEFSSVTRPAKAYFPMFSIVKNANGLMGVIETGAETSALNVFKAGAANSYTGASAQMIYREVSHTVIGERKVQGVSLTDNSFADFKIDYYFSSEGLDYADIAKFYRKLLESQGKITKSTAEPSLSLNVIGAIDVDSHFLGIPCRRLKSLTTYDQLSEIISDLNAKNIDNISMNYIGWNNNGVQNKKINSNFKPLGKLGGQKSLDNLIAVSKEKNTNLYFDADLQSFSSSGNGVSKLKNAIKTMFDKHSLQRKFSYATFTYEKSGYMLVDVNGFSKAFKKYMKSVNNYDESVGLSFNSVSSRLYSNFDSKKFTTKTDMLKAYENSLSDVKHSLAANDANSYMWKYADKIFEAPTSSSRQRIYDGEVPMYQMIICGYIPFTVPSINSNANRNELFLRAVETGGELCFTVMYEDSEAVNGTDYDYLYATTYSKVVEDAFEMYDRYSELENLISGATIEKYELLENGVSETVYSNGVSVIVNYTGEEYLSDDGFSIPANDFGYRR